MNSQTPLSHTARQLAYAGLLPQIIAVLLVASKGEWHWIGLAAGFAYAALIFSFLGGAWWGLALASPQAPRWVFDVSVLPTLIGFVCFIPWTLGWNWPEPFLALLGLIIIAAPLADWEIAKACPVPAGWLALRLRLSLALGLLTMAMAVL